ncbi:hypothetical protein C1645_831153 [Glomus cerebriforme]|uniref:F-box domain-containing protein n=1 Tax=Glomus cerebriforme TaxID=658196 RepID=A0A397SQS0_9GLOM|nr:hypothetical protein C1645_831153 [Glomus cerebriforme]
MSKLNKDILFLIFKEFQDDKIFLYSCLLVNRTWCETAVTILWKIPGRYKLITENANIKLVNVILLHLSEEKRKILKNQGINFFTNLYQSNQQPLFNYIKLWKYLNLQLLESLIRSIPNIEISIMSIIENEIMNLFINENTSFIALSIPKLVDHQLQHISGTEFCFSGLEYLYCYSDNDNQNILKGLSSISKSIKKLTVDIPFDNTNFSGIIKLIEAQKNLNKVCLHNSYYNNMRNIEESLIKNVDTIQYLQIDWIPVTKILSYLVLRSEYIPLNIMSNLIENTKGHLTENCPNLRYIKISINNDNLPEFEKLLVNCQYLNGLVIMNTRGLYYDDLFKILVKSSPISLNKFKFEFNTKYQHKLKYLKLFFDNWKDRPPILLHIDPINYFTDTHIKQIKKTEDLIKKYKTKGIVKDYDINGSNFEFEWNYQNKPLFYSNWL